MKKKYLHRLPWILTIKYRPDGSTYFDKTLPNTTKVSINTDMFDLKMMQHNNAISVQYKICERELEETLQFFADPELVLKKN